MTVVKPPNRNLPTDAVPWGRWVEDNISATDNALTMQAQGITNAFKGINGSLGTLGDAILRASQANDGGYSENLAYTMSGTFDVYSGDVYLVKPDWATRATVIGMGWQSITQTVSGSSQLAPRLIIARDETYLGTNVIKQTAVLTLANASGTGTVQMYPTIGWTGAIASSVSGIYVGMTGTGSLSSGAANYSASATAIVFWS